MASETAAKAEQLLKTLADRLDDLTTLNVVTAVSSLEIQRDANAPERWTMVPKLDAAADGMTTSINLVDGDIRNAISPSFAAPDRKSLVDFHLGQVARSQEIVAGNIKALVELAQKLIG